MRVRAIIALASTLLAASVASSWAQAATAPGRAAPAAAQPAPAAGAAPAARAVDETTLSLAEPGAGGGAVDGSNSILPYVLRMVLVLGLVIAAIYGLFALLRRYSRKPGAPDAYLRVLASASLAPSRGVHIVAVGDKAWLVGSTDSSVALIAPIEDKEVVDALALRAAAAPELPRPDFLSLLASSLGRKGKGGAVEPGDFFSKQRDRLKKI